MNVGHRCYRQEQMRRVMDVDGVEDPRQGLEDILVMAVAVPVSVQDFDGELTWNLTLLSPSLDNRSTSMG